MFAEEITERPIERNRVVAIFQTKIALQAITDYLFFWRNDVGEDVIRQARQYVAQGHEINFLENKSWLNVLLATLGRAGREAFNRVVLEELQSSEIPASLKVAGNEQMARISAA